MHDRLGFILIAPAWMFSAVPYEITCRPSTWIFSVAAYMCGLTRFDMVSPDLTFTDNWTFNVSPTGVVAIVGDDSVDGDGCVELNVDMVGAAMECMAEEVGSTGYCAPMASKCGVGTDGFSAPTVSKCNVGSDGFSAPTVSTVAY